MNFQLGTLAVDRSGQFSRDRKKIPDETVVGDTENGRFRVLVDRDDLSRAGTNRVVRNVSLDKPLVSRVENSLNDGDCVLECLYVT